MRYALFAALTVMFPIVLSACTTPASTPTPTLTPSPMPTPTTLTITTLTADATTVLTNAQTKITCTASSPGGGKLTYTWSSVGGTIIGTLDNLAFWQAPRFVGKFSVSVTVKDDKGNTVSQSLDINVVANRPPVISSLTASPAKLQRGETSTITCLASDPDGDPLTYTWKAGGGDVSGTGNTVIWKAPDTVGNYTISVIVNDGNSGTANSSCTIEVAIPAVTVVLNPIAAESGTINSNGDIDTTVFRVGNNTQNYGLRPFFVFDISSLIGATIKQATVTFTIRQIVGYPFRPSSIWTLLYVDSVNLVGSPRVLREKDYYTTNSNEMARFDQKPPDQVNAIAQLVQALQFQTSRFAVRLRYGLADQIPNYMFNEDDYIDFSTAQLTVTYTK